MAERIRISSRTGPRSLNAAKSEAATLDVRLLVSDTHHYPLVFLHSDIHSDLASAIVLTILPNTTAMYSIVGSN